MAGEYVPDPGGSARQPQLPCGPAGIRLGPIVWGLCASLCVILLAEGGEGFIGPGDGGAGGVLAGGDGDQPVWVVLGVGVGGQFGPDRLELRESLLGFGPGLPEQGAAGFGAEGAAEEEPEHQ